MVIAGETFVNLIVFINQSVRLFEEVYKLYIICPNS